MESVGRSVCEILYREIGKILRRMMDARTRDAENLRFLGVVCRAEIFCG